MRKLQSSDFFAFTRIIKKMGIRGEIKELTQTLGKAKDKETAEKEMQVELIMIFIENIGNAETEIYKFVGSISEKTQEELKELDVFMESLQAIFEDKTIGSFFKRALK